MAASRAEEEFAALLARVRAGDEAALAELLAQYEPQLRATARVHLGPLLRPHLDTADLVQSVHRVLLPCLRQGKYDLTSPAALLALALTLVRRKIADNWRRLKREHPADLEADATEALLVSADPGDDPVRSALLNDTIAHTLESLDDEDRRLIELRLLGHSTAEIARKLQCDPHLLRARLGRLRQRLRDGGHADQL